MNEKILKLIQKLQIEVDDLLCSFIDNTNQANKNKLQEIAVKLKVLELGYTDLDDGEG